MNRKIIVISICSWIIGAYGFIIFDRWITNPIGEYYRTEAAVLVSPHGLRIMMDKGDTSFILVDLRSEQEYVQWHVIGAVNIAAYKDPETTAYGDVKRIVNAFKLLKTTYPEKSLIVYCYSTPCMTGIKIGKMLADHGIYVKHLRIGWNERKYHWTLRNHEGEWDKTKAADYIGTWIQSMIKTHTGSTACPIKNGFGC